MDERDATAATEPVYTIPVTLGSEVLIEITALKLRIKCVLVGMEAGSYIIVKLSAQDLIGNFRSESVKDSPVVVRYLHKNVVYSYTASILNTVGTPAKLFFLSYPTKVEESSPITDLRYECILPAMTMFGNDFVDMVIVDVSRDGCQAVIKTGAQKHEFLYGQIQVGRRLELQVQFPGTNDRFRLVGIVRNVAKDADRIKVGLQFESVSTDAKERLNAFISLVAGAAQKK